MGAPFFCPQVVLRRARRRMGKRRRIPYYWHCVNRHWDPLAGGRCHANPAGNSYVEKAEGEPMRVTRGVILAAVLLGLAARPGLAAGALLSADLGFGGYVVPGRWMPLAVTISGASESARVEIVRGGERPGGTVVESLPCPPPGGGNRVEYPVFAEETGSAVTVRLVAGDQILASQSFQTSAKVFPGHLVLAVALPAAAQQALGRILLPGEPVLAVERSLAELPSIPFGYDGVSGLVMADPGPVLNPAQTKSIRAWLAGGGRLVLCAARPGADSLAALFLPVDRPAAGAGPMAVRLGLGRLVLVEREPSALGLEEWRRLLSFPPYAQDVRLTASRCFPRGQTPQASIPGLPRVYLWILGGWAGTFLVLGLLPRRKGLICLFLLTIIVACAAVPAGTWLMRAWRRGVATRTRAVILPEDGGILIGTRVELIKAGAWELHGVQGSPWGATISLGQDRGFLSPRSGLLWRHHAPVSPYVVQSAGPAYLNLAGWTPPLPPDDPLETREPKVLWDGKMWRRYRDGGGQDREQCPAWLRGESDWLAALAKLAPGCQWLIGQGRLPGLELAVQGSPGGEACWAEPIREEGRS